MSSRWLGVIALAAGLMAVPAAVSSSGLSFRDSAGDVKGGPGPDITRVFGADRAGRISFSVVFAKAPPLAFSRKSTDMLIVTMWTTNKTGPRQPAYALAVHGADTTRVGLVHLKQGGGYSTRWVGPAVVSGKTVTLSFDARQIGSPKTIRFSVAAGREMNAGTGGGSDLAPDKGTFLWAR